MSLYPFARSRCTMSRMTVLFLLLSICAWGNLRGASEEEGRGDRDREAADYSGVFSFYHENDIYLSEDSNYTSGLGIIWVSNAAATYGDRNLIPKMVRGMSFLPSVGDEGFRSFVSFTLGHEIYTPEDVDVVPPPPDQQPYAGVIFVDTTVYGHSSRKMDAYTLRLGCVGPCSVASKWKCPSVETKSSRPP